MAGKVIRELNITRIKYSTIVEHDGVPSFEPQPDAIFRSIMSEKKAEKALKKMLGDDVKFYITKIESGRKRLAMTLEDFIRHATEVSEDEKEDPSEEEGALEEEGDEEAAPVDQPSAALAPEEPAPQPAVTPEPGGAVFPPQPGVPGPMKPPGML